MARCVPFVTALMGCLVCTPAAPGQPRIDALGDALPEGAIARLGTTRMRHFSSPDHYCWGIGCIAWSPDGKMIVSTSYADKIGIEARLWEAATGKPLSVLENNLRYGPSLVRFAPDSKTIAAAARDRIVLWDAATGKELGQLVGHQGTVDSLVFQDGGRTIVSVSRDGIVHWWEVAGRETIRRWQPLADEPEKTDKGEPILSRGIREASFSADGKKLALSTWWATQPNQIYHENMAIVFDLSARKELWRLDTQGYDSRFAFTPDGKRLVLSWAASFSLWDAATGRRLSEFQDLLAWGLEFSSDGKTLAARLSGAIAFWSPDAKMPARQCELSKHNGCCKGPAFSPDGKKVAVEIQRVLQVLDVATGKPVVSWPSYDGGFHDLTFSADGRNLFVNHLAIDLFVNHLAIDTATWQQRKASVDPSDKLDGVQAVSTDRTFCMAGDGKHEDTLFDLKTGRVLVRLEAPARDPGLHGGFFSPKAGLYVMQDRSCTGKEVDTVFAIPSGKRLWQWSTNRHIGTCCWTFSADESRAAFLDLGTRVIHVHDTASGKLIGKYLGSDTLRLSPNGKMLAIGEKDRRNVQIWDLQTGKIYRSLVLDQDAKSDDKACMLWSADNRMLAVGGLDNSIRLWEVASAQVRREFRGHLARASCLAFSPDGKILVSGSEDTTLLIWKVLPDR